MTTPRSSVRGKQQVHLTDCFVQSLSVLPLSSRYISFVWGTPTPPTHPIIGHKRAHKGFSSNACVYDTRSAVSLVVGRVVVSVARDFVALFDGAQVARGDILTYFNQIFVGLCKLFADVDVDVKNGSNLLDRLIKVCRCGAIRCGAVGCGAHGVVQRKKQGWC